MNTLSHRIAAAALLFNAGLASAAEPVALSVVMPKPYQVVQRVAFDPTLAKIQEPGHASFGYADIAVKFEAVKAVEGATWEYRVAKLAGATGRDVPWSRMHLKAEMTSLVASVRVPAGGWYRIEFRSKQNDAVAHQGAVEPVGVGEVFLVAGQSYATNCNDKQFKVMDEAKRVSAYNAAKGTWAVANDPQPVPDNSDGGSFWPPLGDALAKTFRVPIGFANVAWGGTSSRQWMPGEQLHRRLSDTGQTLGRFRAVLWQQGESDVIEKTTTAKYVANVRAIRHSAATTWGTQPPWFLAKSTYHPTVYNDPEGEGRIRKAVDELAVRPGFKMGPDTDSMKELFRGDAKSRRHFSALGQEKAADMWYQVLRAELEKPRLGSIAEILPDLHLLEPAWASPVVHRESSVLVRDKTDAPAIARLAFPAEEILSVASADGRHRFDPQSFMLSADGLKLSFKSTEPVTPILLSELFVPKGSPNSYASRVGHPDQNLMYHPRIWFHDRNVEITYRRREAKFAELPILGTLPKTAARLKAGESFTIGISGDSISTGLDASAKSNAAPHQPGYPDLVVAQLQSKFDSRITLMNRAVGGWSVTNGVKDLDKLLEAKPHLVIVAYGMNDVGRRDPKWFGEQTQLILDRIKSVNHETEVILVSSMLGNAEWTATPREMFAKYRDELAKGTGAGVALADATAVWDQMLKQKHDHDLTGNGLNHPNDFGHRLYAQSVLSILR